MPHAELPLRRHTLVTLTAAGRGTRDPALAADPLVRAWAERGWPLIVRRASPDEADAGRVPLGLPLPPSAGKRRIALNAAADALATVGLLPALSDVLVAAPTHGARRCANSMRSACVTACRAACSAASHGRR